MLPSMSPGKALGPSLRSAKTRLSHPRKKGQLCFLFSSLPQPHRFLTHLDPVSMVRAALGRRNCRDLA